MARTIYDEFSQPVAIAYIGPKEQKKDTVCNTTTIWMGYGDVQSVDARLANRFLQFKDVWIKAEKFKEFEKQKVEREAAEANAELEAAMKKAEELKAKAEALKAASDSAPSGEDEGEEADDSALVEQIQTAIMALDSSNEDHFTDKGKPKIAAVRLMMGEDAPEFGSKELNKAFDALS